jgi:hypothetical protein
VQIGRKMSLETIAAKIGIGVSKEIANKAIDMAKVQIRGNQQQRGGGGGLNGKNDDDDENDRRRRSGVDDDDTTGLAGVIQRSAATIADGLVLSARINAAALTAIADADAARREQTAAAAVTSWSQSLRTAGVAAAAGATAAWALLPSRL